MEEVVVVMSSISLLPPPGEVLIECISAGGDSPLTKSLLPKWLLLPQLCLSCDVVACAGVKGAESRLPLVDYLSMEEIKRVIMSECASLAETRVGAVDNGVLD